MKLWFGPHFQARVDDMRPMIISEAEEKLVINDPNCEVFLMYSDKLGVSIVCPNTLAQCTFGPIIFFNYSILYTRSRSP
jgi:hypothetical protein